MPQKNATLICALCPHWRCIHGAVGQCRAQESHLETDSVFAYPLTHENQPCMHGFPPVKMQPS
jgi:hypothetical protein